MARNKKDIPVFLSVIALSVVFSLALDSLGVRAENIMMVYLTGVLIIITETKRLSLGIISSVILVAAFNFLFTEPRYTFAVDDPNYVITFVIFLVVAFIVTALTSKAQQQALRAARDETNARTLYEISSGSLGISGRDRLVAYCAGKMSAAFDADIAIALADGAGRLGEFRSGSPDPVRFSGATPSAGDLLNAERCLARTAPIAPARVSGGKGETAGWSFFPLKTAGRVFGVAGIRGADMTDDDGFPTVFETILSQLALSLERDELYEREEKSRLEIEKEKLRNSLLRSISHDLRTPLTAIAGSTALIVDSFDRLDRETILQLLRDIGTDAVWLNGMVGNLLNMTRIQDGKLAVHRSDEVVDELVNEAVSRVRQTLGDHTLSISLPERVLTVEADATLVIQVLVNLLENAVKHTPPGTHIDIAAALEKDRAVFSVRDTGGGIDPERLDTIFDGNPGAPGADRKRGIGIGLSICRAIIQAHGGTISAENIPGGGACVKFSLPCREGEYGGGDKS